MWRQDKLGLVLHVNLLCKLNLAPSTLSHNSSFRIINSPTAETSICWAVFSFQQPAFLGLLLLLHKNEMEAYNAYSIKKNTKIYWNKWDVGPSIFQEKDLPELKRDGITPVHFQMTRGKRLPFRNGAGSFARCLFLILTARACYTDHVCRAKETKLKQPGGT